MSFLFDASEHLHGASCLPRKNSGGASTRAATVPLTRHASASIGYESGTNQPARQAWIKSLMSATLKEVTSILFGLLVSCAFTIRASIMLGLYPGLRLARTFAISKQRLADYCGQPVLSVVGKHYPEASNSASTVREQRQAIVTLSSH